MSPTLLERAIEVSNNDPWNGLTLAREALKETELRCLKVRCLAVIGRVLTQLGHVDQAALTFFFGYTAAENCRCCCPILDRNTSALLCKLGKLELAVAVASRAVETSSPRQLPVSLLFRAFMLQEAGRPGAAADLCAALPELTPGSTDHTNALLSLADALCLSRTEESLGQARTILARVRKSFIGVENIPLQRAHLEWIEGLVELALSEIQPKESRNLRKSGLRKLAMACRRFHHLGLAALHAAAWADRCSALALNARIDGARQDFHTRINYIPTQSFRVVPTPFGPFADLAAPILAGDPSPLLKFRKATEQGDPLLPYPGEKPQSAFF
jgi:hypothetical protein